MLQVSKNFLQKSTADHSHEQLLEGSFELLPVGILTIDIRLLSVQGQARGYGLITHFQLLPLEGHHFQRAKVKQWLYIFLIPGYEMKYMNIVFPLMVYLWLTLGQGV